MVPMVGVIGNPVHSSPDIKKEVLATRALHPVIGLLRGRLKSQVSAIASGESISKKEITTINDVLKGLVEWLCARLLYETCLCVCLLSFYEPTIEYLASSRSLPRLIEVVKGSIKEKVVRVVILILRKLLHKGSFGAQMVDLGIPQLVQSLKAHAWSDECCSGKLIQLLSVCAKAEVLRISLTVITCSLFLLSAWIISANPLLASDTQLLIIFPQDLLEDLSRLEEGLKENVKQLSSFDKYKQKVLLGHLDWPPMHKDPIFWRENITCFEEHDFQVNYPFSLLIMWL
ncbi:hypothetical protein ACS0TY_036308 [Phlomoides rotata]